MVKHSRNTWLYIWNLKVRRKKQLQLFNLEDKGKKTPHLLRIELENLKSSIIAFDFLIKMFFNMYFYILVFKTVIPKRNKEVKVLELSRTSLYCRNHRRI